jgi:DNA-binding transcriptional MerR regulator
MTERRSELAESYDPRELPPLSAELVCALALPPDLPDELAIAEVAEVIGVSPHTLRYYERIGLVEVGRDSAGHRRYDRDALARVVFVTRLRMSDMPIQVIRRYIDLVKLGDATEPERLALMQAHRSTILRRLQDMQAALAVIECKITTYGGACAP